MAQLKDTLIQGSARVTDTLYANNININDILSTKKLVISSTTAEEHIQFSRTNNINYILFPNNTSSGVGIGYAVGTTYCPLIITKSSIYPGGTTSTISLGSTDNRWNGVYSNTGNFTGTVTADQLSTNTFLNFRRSDGPSYIMLPDSKDLIINNGNTNGTAYADLQIGKTGILNAYGGSLGSTTYPWGQIFNKGYNYHYANNSQYISTVYGNAAQTTVGEFFYNVGDKTNISKGQFGLIEWAPKSNADTTTSGYYEQYLFPEATADLAENKSYNILTTKSTITVSQGGTGVASFTANSLIMSGNTTTAALTTRAIYDRTTVNALSALATWSNSTSIPTMNTLAYWDGRYQTTNNSSNLTYCNKGAFGNAVTYGVDDATANGALGTGTGLTTERSVYYGLVTVNNASQTRATGIYAPTSAGTANQILVSSGGTSAPTWKATAKGAAYATSSNGALTFGLLPIAQGGTEASSAANARANLDVSARIGTGTINLPNYLCLPGFLTDSKKQLRFTYYAGGEINASSATITGNCYIVGVNGKMVGSTMTQTNDAIAITSCGTITLTINKPTRSIQIYINDSGGFKNSTNNTPVAIVSYGLKITLS